MTCRVRSILVLLAGAVLVATNAMASAEQSSATTTALEQAVDSASRSASDKARDQYRHPVQTLQFFGIEPQLTVIELDPGAGWYTKILAPFLAARGRLIEAAPPKGHEKFMQRMDAAHEHIAGMVAFAPPEQVKLGPDNSADIVLTFRNTHDWLNNSATTLDGVFKAAFEVLKSGGVFGVVEHRAKPFANALQSSLTLHRIPEDYMIELGLKTGFRVAGVSEINANPEDPEDINVHRLPPNLAGLENEHQKMKAIGESDRMTIKFVKP